MWVIANMHCIHWVLSQDHETTPFAVYDKHGQPKLPSSGAKFMEFANRCLRHMHYLPMIVDTISLSLELRILQVAVKLTTGFVSQATEGRSDLSP